MTELLDTLPDINVQPAEYKRLLGFPRDYVMTGRARDLADAARAWYAQNGRPWIYARAARNLQITNGSIVIDDIPFTSTQLRKLLLEAEADSAILVATSAGPEVELEAQKLWREEKPDEYFFLEIFGSAIVEHLVTLTGARLCAWAEGRNLAVLPHYSPGYPEWEISDQPRLLNLIKSRRVGLPVPSAVEGPFALETLDSGMLRPKKSLLAVFGLTRHAEKIRRLTDLVPCENCSFASCEFRRAPYLRNSPFIKQEISAALAQTQEQPPPAEPRDASAAYTTSPKALARWADERLTLTFHADGTTEALFNYEGTTCTNMGRTINFHYTVKLGPRDQGYPILAQHCGPAPTDEGHRYMCRYMNNAEHLMVAIDQEKPLLGKRLDEVLTWQRAPDRAGCYCEPASRKHKWGLVLETIHYALAHQNHLSSPRTWGEGRGEGLTANTPKATTS